MRTYFQYVHPHNSGAFAANLSKLRPVGLSHLHSFVGEGLHLPRPISPRIIGNNLCNKGLVTDKAFNHVLYYKAPSDTTLINIQTTCHLQSAVNVSFRTTHSAHILDMLYPKLGDAFRLNLILWTKMIKLILRPISSEI